MFSPYFREDRKVPQKKTMNWGELPIWSINRSLERSPIRERHPLGLRCRVWMMAQKEGASWPKTNPMSNDTTGPIVVVYFDPKTYEYQPRANGGEIVGSNPLKQTGYQQASDQPRCRGEWHP
jgi:hypothetical protein